jgi:hypothetical protein
VRSARLPHAEVVDARTEDAGFLSRMPRGRGVGTDRLHDLLCGYGACGCLVTLT